ncbi:DUF2726 domain-containing protein [Roseiflexus castenholzii]|uniref:DUF2726 domain-containing protein n=1 Tax=Roseiflexus castenholzii (strain DSM 13941 / HLO8) TaxID=383372 RepID=A7NKZ4_ROSCS|nr:DUF2726 domain-containing protein [Roseiflexus castenholzii]ABU58164.1 conserved hypothetical protein [Roseiflexus castenholzii DSM 13941]
MESLITLAATIAVLLVVAGCGVALAAMYPRRRTAASGSTAFPRLSSMAPRISGEPEFLSRLPYTRTTHLLTGDHRALFAALNAAAPDDLAVLPHVRLADILSVEPHTTQPERYRERIRDVVLDVVLCDAQTTAPRLAVLFAQPGAARRAAFIDAALISAGVPVLRLTRDEPPSVDALALQIAAALGMPARCSSFPAEWPAPDEQRNGAAVISMPEVIGVPREPVRYACGRCHRYVAPRARRCPHCGATLAA